MSLVGECANSSVGLYSSLYLRVALMATERFTAADQADRLVTKACLKCASVIQDHHDAIVEGWKEEIDTLLVYAGLFSAVLTVFIVESYNSTQAFLPLPSPPFRPPTSSVLIHIFWFASLVSSLSAAVVGLLAKQWLHKTELGLYGTSRDTARLRQYRLDALLKWRVGTIVALLPIFLQLASALFFAGLLILLWTLHHTVAIVVTIVIGVLFGFVSVTVLAPAFSTDCAYRSPQALAIFAAVQTFWRTFCSFVTSLPDDVALRFPSFWSSPSAMKWGTYHDWAGMECVVMRTRQDELDRRAVEAAHILKLDSAFTDTVLRPCARSLPIKVAVACLQTLYKNQVRHTGLPYCDIDPQSPVKLALVLDAVERCLDSLESGGDLDISDLDVLIMDLRHLRQLTMPWALVARIRETHLRVMIRLLRWCMSQSDRDREKRAHMLLSRLVCVQHPYGGTTREVTHTLESFCETLASRGEDYNHLFLAHRVLIGFLIHASTCPGLVNDGDREFVRQRLQCAFRALERDLQYLRRKVGPKSLYLS
ncbi:hypothetical protein C8Q70DRAFT_1056758 [Cubamyces menziesii]|nr:hypothetical protein C8Q70DRAFT_1056758 [Cubamyces menziesii]